MSVPRLTETSEGFWPAVEVVGWGHKLRDGKRTHMVLRCPGCVDFADHQGQLVIEDMLGGVGVTRVPSNTDLDMLDRAIAEDQVQVLMVGTWRFSQPAEVVEVLHHPKGLGWVVEDLE